MILWSYVHLSTPYEADVDLPFNINPPKGLAVSSSVPERLHARIRGAGWQILLMAFTKNSHFELDLVDRDIKDPSLTNLIVHNDDLTHAAMLPSDVQLVKVEPDSLEMHFSQPFQKRVPIESRLHLVPSSGYMIVGKPMVTPATVLLQGSHEVLDRIESYPTQTVELRNVNEPVTQMITLSDTLQNVLDVLSNEKIQVKYMVEAIGEKIYQSIPVEVDAVPPEKQMLIFPSTISVALRGGVNELAKLKLSQIHARVTYDAVKFDTTETVKPVIEVPQGIQYLSQEPTQLRFVLRKRSLDSLAH